MKATVLLLGLLASASIKAQTANEILQKVDLNMSAENRVVESSMTIHGRRISRTLTSRTYSVGDKKSFTEYLSPAREMGTKMLKLEDRLWIYSPSTDRIIQISGHMLRQSVMGSDFSYEDMMDNRKLTEIYNAEIIATEENDGRKTFVLKLTASIEDVAYHSRKIWVDAQHYVPLREELFAKSGQLLKSTTLGDLQKVQEKWYPMKIKYKDMLKNGDGTEIQINSIKFNQEIPEYIFTKAALKQ
ncbi:MULTISPECIES: outer membrane lipoprotein-sorting protein [unclassified Saccharicrinis]|uniref:outer membrane lipoprotein-sorting protein n=1 Tax=unclassified Saccharicrinis TaxID=2646859 RepID=UPI003D33C5F2